MSLKIFGFDRAQLHYIFMNSDPDEPNTHIEDKLEIIAATIGFVAYAIRTMKSIPFWVVDVMDITIFICTLVFITLYGLKIWAAGSARKYRGWGILLFLMRPGMLIDFFMIAPFLIEWSFMLVSWNAGTEFFLMYPISAIAIGLRLTKIFHYNEVMENLSKQIKKSAAAVGAAFAATIVIICISGSIIYVLEAQSNESIPSIPVALYYVTVTVTTIGYGDIYPITAIGRIFMMVVLGSVGLAVGGYLVASITSALTSNSEDTSEMKAQLDRLESLLQTTIEQNQTLRHELDQKEPRNTTFDI